MDTQEQKEKITAEYAPDDERMLRALLLVLELDPVATEEEEESCLSSELVI
jgi:hypothetical protein